jgi:hypothetical protein
LAHKGGIGRQAKWFSILERFVRTNLDRDAWDDVKIHSETPWNLLDPLNANGRLKLIVLFRDNNDKFAIGKVTMNARSKAINVRKQQEAHIQRYSHEEIPVDRIDRASQDWYQVKPQLNDWPIKEIRIIPHKIADAGKNICHRSWIEWLNYVNRQITPGHRINQELARPNHKKQALHMSTLSEAHCSLEIPIDPNQCIWINRWIHNTTTHLIWSYMKCKRCLHKLN